MFINSDSEKRCFVISPIGPEHSEIRKNADRLYDIIIEPVTKEMKYLPSRSDKIDESGLITRQIVESILSANLIIADLTCSNANVFYELGMSHTIDTPTILLCQKNPEARVPFDIKDHRFIFYDFENTLDVKSKLKKQIISIESGSIESYNPIDRTFKSQIHSLIFKNTLNFLDKIYNFYKWAEGGVIQHIETYSNSDDDFYTANENDIDKDLEKAYNDRNGSVNLRL